MPAHLTRIVPWAQRLLAEILRPGDTALDLTAGNGHDTLFLYQQVGTDGRVFAFDVQTEALKATADRLRRVGAMTTLCSADSLPANPPPGVHLIGDDHARLARYVQTPVRAVIANLGYLPGSDQRVVTRADSTLPALQQALTLLSSGGRLAAVLYSGHPGGEEESTCVREFLRGLQPCEWELLKISAANREHAPELLVAQRR